MKSLASGYGNSGDVTEARRKAWEGEHFRYIIVTTSGGNPGMIGGSFNYEVRGTNNIKDLLKPSIIRDSDEVIDTKAGKEIEKKQLARQYLKSLDGKQRAALMDKALLNFLTGSPL